MKAQAVTDSAEILMKAQAVTDSAEILSRELVDPGSMGTLLADSVVQAFTRRPRGKGLIPARMAITVNSILKETIWMTFLVTFSAMGAMEEDGGAKADPVRKTAADLTAAGRKTEASVKGEQIFRQMCL